MKKILFLLLICLSANSFSVSFIECKGIDIKEASIYIEGLTSNQFQNTLVILLPRNKCSVIEGTYENTSNLFIVVKVDDPNYDRVLSTILAMKAQNKLMNIVAASQPFVNDNGKGETSIPIREFRYLSFK